MQATEALRITSPELVKFRIMDEIIPEPLGGAHSDPMAAFPAIKDAIMSTYHQYVRWSPRLLRGFIKMHCARLIDRPDDWPPAVTVAGHDAQPVHSWHILTGVTRMYDTIRQLCTTLRADLIGCDSRSPQLRPDDGGRDQAGPILQVPIAGAL